MEHKWLSQLWVNMKRKSFRQKLNGGRELYLQLICIWELITFMSILMISKKLVTHTSYLKMSSNVSFAFQICEHKLLAICTELAHLITQWLKKFERSVWCLRLVLSKMLLFLTKVLNILTYRIWNHLVGYIQHLLKVTNWRLWQLFCNPNYSWITKIGMLMFQ